MVDVQTPPWDHLQMGTWIDTLRQKQAKATALRAELAALEAELRDAKLILSGRMNEWDEPIKPKSRHGFTGGKRARPIQEGSSVWWTKRVLEENGTPMTIDDIVVAIKLKAGIDVKKTTLISNLSRYIKHRDTFE